MSASLISLSRFYHLNGIKRHSVSHKKCSRQTEKWTSASPCCEAFTLLHQSAAGLELR